MSVDFSNSESNQKIINIQVIDEFNKNKNVKKKSFFAEQN